MKLRYSLLLTTCLLASITQAQSTHPKNNALDPQGSGGVTDVGSAKVITTGGSTPRTVSDHFKPLISILDYGNANTCNGIQNDTAAFNAAFIANNGGVITGPANATCIITPLQINNPLTVQFPASMHIVLQTGTWTSTALLQISSDGVTIDGGYWDFNNAVQAGSNSAMLYSGGFNNITIKNGYWVGGQTYGFTIHDASDLTIDNNHVSGAGQNAIQVWLDTKNVTRTTISNNTVNLESLAAAGKGIAVTNTSAGSFSLLDTSIHDNKVNIASNLTTLGIEVWAASHPVNYNTSIVNNRVVGGAFGISCNGCASSTVATNSLRGQTGFGLEFASTVSSTMTGNIIKGGGVLVTGIAVDENVSTDNTITGNTLTDQVGTSSVGIYTDSPRTSIVANTVSSGATGIEVNTADTATITGNTLNNTSATNFGIWVIESSRSIVSNNSVKWGGNAIAFLANAGVTRDFNIITSNNAVSITSNAFTNTGGNYGIHNIIETTGDVIDCPSLAPFTCNYLGTVDPNDPAHGTNSNATGTFLNRNFTPGAQFWVQEATGFAGWYPVMVRRFGTTANRPTIFSGYVGVEYFDTTLGLPVWWKGAVWVDATGATR